MLYNAFVYEQLERENDMVKEKKVKDPNEIRIAAKALAELNMPDFDPQLFWVKSKMKFKTPFGIFPGIFSTLDKYQKDLATLNRTFKGQFPTWICGDIAEAIPCPHWSKFCFTDEETGITVSGAMDDCFLKKDGFLLISDNKLAKVTDTQDKLRPLYEAQLNIYATIAKKIGLGEASELQLVYHEPVTTGIDTTEDFDKIYLGDEYLLKFNPKVIEILLDSGLTSRLLRKAKEILSMDYPPEALDGKISKDLELVLEMAKAYQDGMSRRPAPVPVVEVPKFKKVNVSFRGAVVGAVNVSIESGKDEIQKVISEDPLLPMVCPEMYNEPELVSWSDA